MSTSELPRTNDPVWSTELSELLPAFERRHSDSSIWTEAAPRKVVGHFSAGDPDRACRAWREHLGRRKSPVAKTAFEQDGLDGVLRWGLAKRVPEAARLAAFASPANENGALRGTLETALAQAGGALEDGAALVHLACAYALPALASTGTDRLWWKLVTWLHQTAMDAAALDVSAQPLVHQWLAGELPLALAVLFPELAPCQELLPQARRAFSVGFEELLDGRGMPHSRHLAVQWPLVACWTRARILGDLLNAPVWDDAALAQYPFTVRQMLRLARCDGTSLFEKQSAGEEETSAPARFFAAAVKHSRAGKNRAALRAVGWSGLRKKMGGARKRPPRPSYHSEWAQAAVLRPAWHRSSPHLGITYADQTVRGELVVGGQPLFTGDWQFTCRVDDTKIMSDGDWEEVCWVRDDDVDYLELQMHLTDQLRLQRQICLAREDRFLFVADALLGELSQSLELTTRIPLGRQTTAVVDAHSREVALVTDKPRALVFPLALPEWQIDPRGGEVAVADGALALRQKFNGQGLYAPLWIDLAPGRHGKPFTWRQLTVADERRIVPRDLAAGYRIQFGAKQWLVYRSLSPARNRTLLGHNLSTEFLIARFGRNGSVTPLIEVE